MGPVVVLIAGFPDNHFSAWSPEMVAELEREFHLFFFCFPEFSAGNAKFKSWGYSFADIVEIISAVMREYTRTPFYLIGHDWGALVALKFQNKYPKNVLKLVLFDVGMVRWHTARLNTILLILSTQVWWALAYLMSQTLSLLLGELMFKNFYLSPIRLPLCPLEELQIHESDLTVRRCYPYYQFFKSKLLLKDDVTVSFPSCPLLFMVL